MSTGRAAITGLGELGRLLAGEAAGGSDRELVERFRRSGDEAAFAAIVARHGAPVARVCRSVLGHPADVDDAFQATFLILARRAGAIREVDRLGSWLLGVARRVALRARRRARGRADREAGTPADLAGLPDRAPVVDPARRELGLAVRAEVGQLPRVEQLAVALCLLDGLTHREAADRLGWPLGTVKTRVARGRDRLRVRLARRGLTPALPWLGEALAHEGAEAAALARSLAKATAQAASRLAVGHAVPSGLLAPGALPLARHTGRGLLIAPGPLAVAGLGLALAIGAVPGGPAGLASSAAIAEPTPASAPMPGSPQAGVASTAPGSVAIDARTGPARRVEVADVDGDGRPDLIVAGDEAVAWYRNPTWERRAIATQTDPAWGRVGDLAVLDADGDGRAEVALAVDVDEANPQRGRLVLARPGPQLDDPWTLRPLPDVPGIRLVRAGDLDGDGRPELLAAFATSPATPDGRPAKLAGISTLQLDLDHPQGGHLKKVLLGSWLDIKAVAVRPCHVQVPVPNRMMVGLTGIKVEPVVASSKADLIEIATPNGLWLLQIMPGRVRVTVSGPDEEGPIQLIPAQPFRAFQRGSLSPLPGGLFVATVAADPGEPVSIWERQESPELPPRVDAEQDPVGAARRIAAVVDRIQSRFTNFGTSTLAPTPLDPTRRGGSCVAVADLDGDGADEILAGYGSDRPGVVSYRREGQAWVGTVLDPTIRPSDLRVADLDGDGRPEVVAVHRGVAGLVVLHPPSPDAVPPPPTAPTPIR